jgi:penicillin-binding protein 2
MAVSAGRIARAIYNIYEKYIGLGSTDKPYDPVTAVSKSVIEKKSKKIR